MALFVNTYNGRQQPYSRESNVISDFVLCYGQDPNGGFNFRCARIPGCCGNTCCNSGGGIIRANDDGNAGGGTAERIVNGMFSCSSRGADNSLVEILCEYGCCDDGCCSRDMNWWWTTVWIVAAFTTIFIIAGIIAVLLCMWRARSNAKAQEPYSTAGSVIYPTTGSIVGPVYTHTPGPGSIISQPAASTGYVKDPLSGKRYF